MFCYFNLGSGRSKTWRFNIPNVVTDVNDAKQAGHLDSLYRSILSGVWLCLSVSPLWPGWPPLLFLPFWRNEWVRGGFESPSLEGGLELLLLFLLRRFSNSAILAD